MKEEYTQMCNQIKELNEILDDSQKSLIASEKRIDRLEKEKQRLESTFKQEEQRY